jgi:hypothetical protein
VIVAGGLEPVLRHSSWYSRPAEIGSFLFTMLTVSGRTGKTNKTRQHFILFVFSLFFMLLFWALKTAKDLTPYLYPELKLFTAKTF